VGFNKYGGIQRDPHELVLPHGLPLELSAAHESSCDSPHDRLIGGYEACADAVGSL
jgi:hypothetical protein